MRRTYQVGDEPVAGYKLCRSLGKGTLGEVWEAAGPGGTQVAFKIVDLREKGSRKEFRAIRRLKRVRHPNLVPILAWWVRDEEGRLVEEENAERVFESPSYRPAELFIAMGLGDRNLLERLKECKGEGLSGIPAPELVGYIEDAARAVDHLNSPKHDLGQGPVALHHGDIKPSNLLIVSGAAQVSDSGLAGVLGQRNSSTSPAVTLAFAPPEILEDSQPHATTDQYALALTYFYLRTGTLPFSKPDNGTIVKEIIAGHLDFSRVTPSERAVLERASARQPDQRFPSCLEMARELRRAVEGVGERPVGLRIEPGSESIPGHKLVRLLGKGAFGELWEALTASQRVALKIIPDLDRTPTRLQQELRALALAQRLEHPYLLTPQGWWLLDRQGQVIPVEQLRSQPAPVPVVLALATRLAEKNLAQVLEEYQARGQTGIPAAELLGYLRPVADAIDFLNAPVHPLKDKRVALQHRNLKPENLLLLDGRCLVSDFHMLKPLGVQEISADIHQESVGYTFHYSAPEVMRGRVTKASDQFSLAVVYCHLRTGQLPFDRLGSALEMMMRQMEGRSDLSRLSEPERPILARALSVSPEDRFPSCMAMIVALEQALGLAVPFPARVESGRSEKTAPLLGTTKPTPPPEPSKQPIRPSAASIQIKEPTRGAPRFAVPGYQLITKLGQGGFGFVWEARGPGDIPLALKFIELDNKNAIKGEMRALEMMRKIRHPNILSIFGFWEQEKYLVIALELAEGTLGDRLKELKVQGQSGLPMADLLRFMEDAAKGIDYLNEPRHDLGDGRKQSIQHRDIKPHNLLLVGGSVKVADFGLAKMLERSVGGHSGGLSVAYAAPEFFNEQTATTSDQYSLAVSYCQLRSGRLPFTGTEAKILMGHLKEPPDLSMLPTEGERQAVARALAKNPKERFPSCKEFVHALQSSQKASIAPRAPSFPKAIPPQANKTAREPAAFSWTGILVVLVLIALGSLGFLLFLLYRRRG